MHEPNEQFRHPMSLEEFRKRAHETVDYICDYYARVDDLPVRSPVEPGYLHEQLPKEAPQQGETWEAIMEDVNKCIVPGLTHWQSSNFFAYFPCNSSFPAMLGEMLCAGFATQNFSWIGSPAATELETIVMDWLGKLLGLPQQFLSRTAEGSFAAGGGVIQGTASEATLVCMLAARARAMQGRPSSDMAKLVAYTSDQAHSSVKKATMIAGVTHLRALKTEEADEWALQAATLQQAVRQDLQEGLIPFYLCATVGTTSTATVDDLRGLGTVSKQHNVWVHVDAAYAGATAVLPSMRHWFDGVELADSFSFNPHKWLLTNFDCAALWVADSGPLKAALSLTPAYLQAKGNALDYKDWQVPLGRRFRALKVWFVLRTYGQQGLQSYIEHHLRLTKLFQGFVEADERFEIPPSAPPRFGLVCFALKGMGKAANAALLEAINATGKTFIIHTEVGGKYMLRFALGSTYVQQQHVEAAWRVITSKVDKVVNQQANLP
ncbi:hypothetical protein ABBQ38_004950 [Trebouxia sp. C0009 RCD-2024]